MVARKLEASAPGEPAGELAQDDFAKLEALILEVARDQGIALSPEDKAAMAEFFRLCAQRLNLEDTVED